MNRDKLGRDRTARGENLNGIWTNFYFYSRAAIYSGPIFHIRDYSFPRYPFCVLNDIFGMDLIGGKFEFTTLGHAL